MEERTNLRTYFKAFGIHNNPRWLVMSAPILVSAALYKVGLLVWSFPEDIRQAKVFDPSLPWLIFTPRQRNLWAH